MLKGLIQLYKNTQSPLERANYGSQIRKEVEELAYDKYQNEYASSLHFDEDLEYRLQCEREAYVKGFIEAIEICCL